MTLLFLSVSSAFAFALADTLSATKVSESSLSPKVNSAAPVSLDLNGVEHDIYNGRGSCQGCLAPSQVTVTVTESAGLQSVAPFSLIPSLAATTVTVSANIQPPVGSAFPVTLTLPMNLPQFPSQTIVNGVTFNLLTQSTLVNTDGIQGTLTYQNGAPDAIFATVTGNTLPVVSRTGIPPNVAVATISASNAAVSLRGPLEISQVLNAGTLPNAVSAVNFASFLGGVMSVGTGVANTALSAGETIATAAIGATSNKATTTVTEDGPDSLTNIAIRGLTDSLDVVQMTAIADAHQGQLADAHNEPYIVTEDKPDADLINIAENAFNAEFGIAASNNVIRRAAAGLGLGSLIGGAINAGIGIVKSAVNAEQTIATAIKDTAAGYSSVATASRTASATLTITTAVSGNTVTKTLSATNTATTTKYPTGLPTDAPNLVSELLKGIGAVVQGASLATGAVYHGTALDGTDIIPTGLVNSNDNDSDETDSGLGDLGSALNDALDGGSHSDGGNDGLNGILGDGLSNGLDGVLGDGLGSGIGDALGGIGDIV